MAKKSLNFTFACLLISMLCSVPSVYNCISLLKFGFPDYYSKFMFHLSYCDLKALLRILHGLVRSFLCLTPDHISHLPCCLDLTD
uniref:Uncharacterized protein n=1 Tax=Arundo donax TaxID=35708 RepID=A0A0A8Z424_ARUDO